MGKRKRPAPSRPCPDCDELVPNSKKACPSCNHVFVASAWTLQQRARADKKQAALAAAAAVERKAAAEEATKRPPRFLRDSSTKPDTSTKPSLLTVLRLEPNIHPGTPEGLPEYVATRIISFLVCPDTDAKQVYEPPYVTYYAGLVTRCELERRPLPRLPRPNYVIRKACGGLHSALVTEHGQLYTWGHSGHGQTGQSTREVIATPRRLPSTAWEGRAAKEARRYARPTYHAR